MSEYSQPSKVHKLIKKKPQYGPNKLVQYSLSKVSFTTLLMKKTNLIRQSSIFNSLSGSLENKIVDKA